MKSKLKSRLGTFAFLTLSALPLVYYCGTTWRSNADDLITTLISIENWRFFFWGESRFGTLVPLLAKPFTDMRSNLLFQNFIHAFSILIFIYSISRVFYRNQAKSKNRTFVFFLLILIFLATNLVYLRLLISGTPYAAPLGIFGLSLLLAKSNLQKTIVVPILIFLIATSCWVNPLNGYYLAPLLILFLSLKKYKNIFYELSIAYLLANFGVFFIILGVANGERSGILAPNLLPFKVYNWWVSLIIVQILLVLHAAYRRKFKENQATYYGFLLTWVTLIALTSLRHIHLNDQATRYFITGSFVSMCITMRLLEELLFESKFLRAKASAITEFFSRERVVATTFLILLLANGIIIRNLQSDFPIQQPQKKLLSAIFDDNPDSYRFASGDFWYAWPTKLFVAKPEDIFVTSYRSENQYDIATDSKKEIQSRLKSGDLGLCFGEVKKCESEIRQAVFRLYGSYKVQVEITDLTLITKNPILVHKLRVNIASQKTLNYAIS